MAILETTTTAAAATESAKLQRHFGRFDILFFLICTIVGVDTIASVASSGGEAFTWMVVLAVVFFVPQALLFAELGSAFPQEGGPYFWTRLAFGHLVGRGEQLPLLDHQPGLDRRHAGGRLRRRDRGVLQQREPAVHAGVLRGHAGLRLGVGARRHHVVLRAKWLPTAGAFARFLLLGLFTVTVRHLRRQARRARPRRAARTSPSYAGFVALVGVLLFNYVGFELPSSAGEEMTNPKRDVPFAIARSAVGSVLLYALPVLGILVVLPSSAVTNFSGFVDAMKDVFTVYGGSIAKDGTPHAQRRGHRPRRRLRDPVHPLPAHLGRHLDHGLGPGAGGVLLRRRGPAVPRRDQRQVRHPGPGEHLQRPRRDGDRRASPRPITSGNAAKYFGAVLGVTISTTLISYLGIYPAVWKLRRSHPDVDRPFRMPWMKPLTVILMLLVVVATIQLVAPGLGDSWFGANYAPDGWDPSQKWVYLLTEVIPVLSFAVIGVLFWWLGRSTRAEVVELDAIPAEAAD